MYTKELKSFMMGLAFPPFWMLTSFKKPRTALSASLNKCTLYIYIYYIYICISLNMFLCNKCHLLTVL